MRERPVTVFAAGFVLGLASLAALLWQAGLIRTVKAPAAQGRARLAAMPMSAPPGEVRPTAEGRLMVPVRGVRVESLRDDFGEMRGGHRHEAIDIMAARGTPVLAAGAGTVVKLFLSKPGGLTVYEFDDSRTYCYYYAHLADYAPGLREGTLLKRGDVLGYVGSTGNASADAPHLHFAIFKLGPERHWWEGVAMDPYRMLTGSSGE